MHGVGGEPAFLALVGLGEGFVVDRGEVAVRRAAGGLAFVEVTQPLGQVLAAAVVVRALEADDHGEGLFARAVLFEPFEREVGGDVIHPAAGGDRLAVDLEGAILVDPLVDETGGVLESGARPLLVSHVPFAEVGGAVTGIAQEDRMVEAVFGEGLVVAEDAVDVGVLAGEESGAPGRADRVGDEGVAETDAIRREAIQRGRLEPRVARLVAVLLLHGTHRIPAVVIRDDKDEVRLLPRCISAASNERAKRGEEGSGGLGHGFVLRERLQLGFPFERKDRRKLTVAAT